VKSVAQVKKLVMAKMWSIDAHIVQPDDCRSPASAGKSRFLERSPIVHFRILEMESDQNSAMRGHGDSAEPDSQNLWAWSPAPARCPTC
jgi:hypothetical protein